MPIKRTIAIALSTVLLFAFTLSTDPHKISLISVLIPFILLGIIFYNTITLGAEKLFGVRKAGRLRLFSLVGTVVLVNFALLSSIGQLTAQDTLLTALITIVGGFYLYKFRIN